MSKISNLQIYYQRKYKPKGMTDSVIVEDEEHLVSQLCSIWPTGDIDMRHFYQAYPSNYPNYGVFGFTGFYRTFNPQEILAYRPGLIYLDEWYYTWADFFSSYDLQVLEKWVAGTDSDYPISWQKINNLQTSNVRNGSTFFIIDQPNLIFWIGNDGRQLVMIPKISVSPDIKQNFIIKKAHVNLDLVLWSFNENVDVRSLYTKDLNYGTYIIQEIWGTVNGIDKRIESSTGDFYGSTILCAYSNVSTNGTASGQTLYTTYSENKKRFSEWIQDFKKVKFYVMFSSNSNDPVADNIAKDNIWYYHQNSSPTTGKWNWFKFLNDVSETSQSPISGFGTSDGSCFENYLLRYDDELGQESNSPNDKPDPNDRDPGHGPRGSSGDKGGNGDHDNTSDKIIPPGIPTLSGSGVGLFTIFNPTASQLAELGKKLWNPTALQIIKQYFSSPMETILGLGIIPVQPRQGLAKNIMLGIYDTEISCTTVSSDYVIKDCGSISINRYYGSYLDYDPYTRISLYLPYIGEIQIDPDEVMQSVLGVEYHVNVVTGDCVAIITSDGFIVYTAAGNCIRQLPIGQTDYSNIINTAVSAVSTIATAVVGGSAASSVGNAVAGAAKTEAGKQVAEARASSQLIQEGVGAGTSLINQVMQSKMRYNHAGSIGVGSGQLSYQKPYLTIERPNLDLADNYKSFVGYPCNETMQLSHCSGFTQIESCKLSVSGATDGELTEILAFLIEGVII